MTVLSLAQTASQLVAPDIRRVGEQLACLCGSCKNTVGSCPMLGCHYALPSREKIAAMQSQRTSDQAIVDRFVKEQGLRALAVPPAQGFNFLAWAMPFIAIALGVAAIWLYIRRFHRKSAPASALDPEVLERYKERIEKDLEKQA
jgi:cytochrome c-type biogenesis protein CcmH